MSKALFKTYKCYINGYEDYHTFVTAQSASKARNKYWLNLESDLPLILTRCKVVGKEPMATPGFLNTAFQYGLTDLVYPNMKVLWRSDKEGGIKGILTGDRSFGAYFDAYLVESSRGYKKAQIITDHPYSFTYCDDDWKPFEFNSRWDTAVGRIV